MRKWVVLGPLTGPATVGGPWTSDDLFCVPASPIQSMKAYLVHIHTYLGRYLRETLVNFSLLIRLCEQIHVFSSYRFMVPPPEVSNAYWWAVLLLLQLEKNLALMSKTSLSLFPDLDRKATRGNNILNRISRRPC